MWSLLLKAAGIAEELCCLPLHSFQGTTHQGERGVFHDGPQLGFVQPQEAVYIEQVSHATQEYYPQGGYARHTLQVAVETASGINLHPQDVDGVLDGLGVFTKLKPSHSLTHQDGGWWLQLRTQLPPWCSCGTEGSHWRRLRPLVGHVAARSKESGPVESNEEC